MSKELWRPGNMLYPLPVVMVSVRDKNGKNNIITLAWVGTICSDPAMVSISVRPERYSYNILKETGEFVINLTTRELAYATDYCGVKSGRDVDKFKEMNLTAIEADKVNVPMIEESPVNIECRVRQVMELGSHDMFIADVLAVHADTRYMDADNKFSLEKSDPIVYSHGTYMTCGEELGRFGFSVKKDNKKSGRKRK
jgi:flavin reductase (DIM6/NTAB) family NADH-FMN oxidoreductase RutF